MSFDLREVLRRAWQITWKHKSLWVFGALPMLPVLLYLPLIFYFFLSGDFAERIPALLSSPASIALVLILIFLTIGVSLLLQVFGRSALTFGILQIEAGTDRLAFNEISRGGRLFFWRTLGVTLLASLMMMAALTVLSACLSLAGVVTLGFGALIGNMVSIPVTLLAYAVLEQSQSAAVADAMNPTRAIEHAWELVTENFNLFAPLTAVLYAVLSIAGSVALVPVMAPLLLVVLTRFSTEFLNPSLLWIGIVCFIVFLPVYFVYQAVSTLYVRVVHVIAYLRLTRSSKLPPLPANGEATS
ncbi:MAG TPA: hypothetical protein VK897_15720 [Anaerolineales bacterium]|nr:hypothetical protein [Anaerolineales bacterium]